MTNIRKSSQIDFHFSKSVHGSVAGPKPDAPTLHIDMSAEYLFARHRTAV